jgi:hypothetical protein
MIPKMNPKFTTIPGVQDFFEMLGNTSYLDDSEKQAIGELINKLCAEILEESKECQHPIDDETFIDKVNIVYENHCVFHTTNFDRLWSAFVDAHDMEKYIDADPFDMIPGAIEFFDTLNEASYISDKEKEKITTAMNKVCNDLLGELIYDDILSDTIDRVMPTEAAFKTHNFHKVWTTHIKRFHGVDSEDDEESIL